MAISSTVIPIMVQWMKNSNWKILKWIREDTKGRVQATAAALSAVAVVLTELNAGTLTDTSAIGLLTSLASFWSVFGMGTGFYHLFVKAKEAVTR